jgi:GT2 family glycosyltransferase
MPNDDSAALTDRPILRRAMATAALDDHAAASYAPAASGTAFMTGAGEKSCLTDVAVIAIGRNEGERLRRCLQSVAGRVAVVVYVDSGSTDASVALSRSLGAELVCLDMSTPFTAARARNAGAQRALQLNPALAWLQFVDGDCEVDAGWLDTAHDYLNAHPDVAAAFGRRRERHPDRSIFNRLCDMEWNVAPGDVRSCGGDVMMRSDAWLRAGGYRDDLIAGEEPELCIRLRGAGWRIRCLDAPMTLHDAAITRWGQWWRRTVRTGYAFAEGSHLFGAPPERHWVRESRRSRLWGLAIPALISVLALAVSPWFLLLLALYPLQMLRLYLGGRDKSRALAMRAVFTTLGYFPEAAGHLRYWRNRLLARRAALIEYK